MQEGASHVSSLTDGESGGVGHDDNGRGEWMDRHWDGEVTEILGPSLFDTVLHSQSCIQVEYR